jgi:hypothetical protein
VSGWGEQGLLGRFWNVRAVHRGYGRIISTYATRRGEPIRVITEDAWDITVIWHVEEL